MPADNYTDYVARLKKKHPDVVVATRKEWEKIRKMPVTGADTWLKNFGKAVKKEIITQKETRTEEQIAELKKAGLTDKEIAKLRGQR